MFPIRDHNPATRQPWVTMALIAVNIGLFLAYFPFLTNPVQEYAYYSSWGIVPREIMAGRGWPGLATSMFLHGGWMHLLGNMLFLWVFADNLEEELGHLGFLGFYLACGVAAGLVHVWAEPASLQPAVGASGAIAGVMGGYLLLFPRAKVDVLLYFIIFFRIIPVPAWIVLGIWFALQVFNGTAVSAAEAGVAYWEHIGGFVAGIVVMLPAWIGRGGRAFWARSAGAPPHPEAVYTRSAVPVVRRR